MKTKQNRTRLLMCCRAALLLLAAVAFCGMAHVGGSGSSAFSFFRSPRCQDDWRLALVNERYAVTKGYAPPLLALSNGEQVDERMYPDLQRMFDDARAEGLSPFVRAGFRSRADQAAVMESKVDELLRQGWPEKAARKEARRAAAKPGHSEHELGLAVDINSLAAGDEQQLYGWLEENAWRYGFILRYPQSGEDVTRIAYEPWHYRYVGPDAARELYEQGRTLEEYLGVA